MHIYIEYFIKYKEIYIVNKHNRKCIYRMILLIIQGKNINYIANFYFLPKKKYSIFK
jgi:hypothetical protein